MSLFTSRKFWVVLVALVVIIVQAFLPNFTINQDLLVDGIVIVAAYIVSLAVDPGDTETKLVGMVNSRRFWIALVSLIVLFVQVVRPDFQLDQELMTAYLLVVVPVIVGLAIDPGKDGNKWKNLLSDKKFYTALVGVLMVVLDALHVKLPFNLTPDQVVAACVAFGGYIVALALEKRTLIAPMQH